MSKTEEPYNRPMRVSHTSEEVVDVAGTLQVHFNLTPKDQFTFFLSDDENLSNVVFDADSVDLEELRYRLELESDGDIEFVLVDRKDLFSGGLW